jgi:hypothetical protein
MEDMERKLNDTGREAKVNQDNPITNTNISIGMLMGNTDYDNRIIVLAPIPSNG